MARIFPVVKKVVQTISDIVNFRLSTKPAIAVSTVNSGTLVKPAVTAGVAASQPPFTLLSAETPAVTTSLNGVSGTATQIAVTPAVAASLNGTSGTATQQAATPAVATSLNGASGTAVQLAATPAPAVSLNGASGSTSATQTPAIVGTTTLSATLASDTPAAEIVQVVYSLTRRVGANAAANAGPQNWTNPNNANGIHDATSATSSGNLLAAQDYNIDLNYADSVNKTDLAITSVKLFLYAQVTGDATGLQSTVTARYNIGAGLVTLETIAGNFNSLTTPRQYDLTGTITTWAQIDALATRVRHQTIIAGTLVAGAVDAFEVEIVATKTDLL